MHVYMRRVTHFIATKMCSDPYLIFFFCISKDQNTFLLSLMYAWVVSLDLFLSFVVPISFFFRCVYLYICVYTYVHVYMSHSFDGWALY